jgi:hypothetical protein
MFNKDIFYVFHVSNFNLSLSFSPSFVIICQYFYWHNKFLVLGEKMFFRKKITHQQRGSPSERVRTILLVIPLAIKSPLPSYMVITVDLGWLLILKIEIEIALLKFELLLIGRRPICDKRLFWWRDMSKYWFFLFLRKRIVSVC